MNAFIEENRRDIAAIEEKRFNSSKNESEKIKNLKAEMKTKILMEIATAGLPLHIYDWKILRSIYLVFMKDTCLFMFEKYNDIPESSSNSFDDLLKDLVDLLYSYENPPFTLQRITELIISPEAHYSSCKKYLYALEKTLLVTAD